MSRNTVLPSGKRTDIEPSTCNSSPPPFASTFMQNDCISGQQSFSRVAFSTDDYFNLVANYNQTPHITSHTQQHHLSLSDNQHTNNPEKDKKNLTVVNTQQVLPPSNNVSSSTSVLHHGSSINRSSTRPNLHSPVSSSPASPPGFRCPPTVPTHTPSCAPPLDFTAVLQPSAGNSAGGGGPCFNRVAFSTDDYFNLLANSATTLSTSSSTSMSSFRTNTLDEVARTTGGYSLPSSTAQHSYHGNHCTGYSSYQSAGGGASSDHVPVRPPHPLTAMWAAPTGIDSVRRPKRAVGAFLSVLAGHLPAPLTYNFITAPEASDSPSQPPPPNNDTVASSQNQDKHRTHPLPSSQDKHPPPPHTPPHELLSPTLAAAFSSLAVAAAASPSPAESSSFERLPSPTSISLSSMDSAHSTGDDDNSSDSCGLVLIEGFIELHEGDGLSLIVAADQQCSEVADSWVDEHWRALQSVWMADKNLGNVKDNGNPSFLHRNVAAGKLCRFLKKVEEEADVLPTTFREKWIHIIR
eukprot:GHVQ01003941.1.p1 GENE.GHVQ01003941.1~~GHVQ01003941.1.p1  ORF type:complete len:522 (-),score=125.94 GHVQ01003941.1:1570-3135(-)